TLNPSTFQWELKDKCRILARTEKEQGGPLSLETGRFYGSAVITDDNEISTVDLVVPNLQGKTSTAIPFVFINAIDLSPNPDKPPLRGLANICLTIYNGE